jgi:hypothetical protein
MDVHLMAFAPRFISASRRGATAW